MYLINLIAKNIKWLIGFLSYHTFSYIQISTIDSGNLQSKQNLEVKKKQLKIKIREMKKGNWLKPSVFFDNKIESPLLGYGCTQYARSK